MEEENNLMKNKNKLAYLDSGGHNRNHKSTDETGTKPLLRVSLRILQPLI